MRSGIAGVSDRLLSDGLEVVFWRRLEGVVEAKLVNLRVDSVCESLVVVGDEVVDLLIRILLRGDGVPVTILNTRDAPLDVDHVILDPQSPVFFILADFDYVLAADLRERAAA